MSWSDARHKVPFRRQLTHERHSFDTNVCKNATVLSFRPFTRRSVWQLTCQLARQNKMCWTLNPEPWTCRGIVKEFNQTFESGAPPYNASPETVATMHRATAELKASGIENTALKMIASISLAEGRGASATAK